MGFFPAIRKGTKPGVCGGCCPEKPRPPEGAAGCHLELDVKAALSYVLSVPDDGKNSASRGSGVEMPFEEALKKLEATVEAMESGDLPLENLLKRFEEGTRLVKLCQARLEQAEVQIQKLEKDAAGQTIVKPIEKGSALLANE
jgi:exodeoxyribonuclease VII small subunit